MVSLETKASQLIAEAEKKLTPFSIFNIFFNKSGKYEQAGECYQRAANLLKGSKNWPKAAACFARCAEIHQEINNQYDAALNFSQAASCYKKCDSRTAIACLEKAIEVLTDIGRFSMAAKHHQTIAEIYELQLLDVKNAVCHFEQASEYFRMEDNNVSAEACLLKVAHYSAIFEDYQKAIEIYQQVALVHIGATLLRYNVQVYLFKAALCHLCADLLSGKHVIRKYVELFPMFEDTVEGRFLAEIVDRIDEDDLNGFLVVRLDFTSKFRCDELIVTLLVRIEKILCNGVDLL
ncbi:alpha-soluble NSF attachment protein-like [Harmonia axyridis]|uniref:alpha-soluble NSF attachment protein-like n=1 Tax=Harmonia axyridis TaxID=115357 RepID=UPI001E275DF3|nr:alpha-soluble NSF attachment protein-like [Harmonia axyridis]